MLVNGSEASRALAVEVRPSTGRETFRLAGTRTWVVPPGVRSVDVTVVGASGGGPDPDRREFTMPDGAAGLGARVEATIGVTPGEVLLVHAAQRGQHAGSAGRGGRGFRDGGRAGQEFTPEGLARWAGAGGGASAVLRDGVVLVVAGGGGGGGARGISSHAGGDAGNAGAAGESGHGPGCGSGGAAPSGEAGVLDGLGEPGGLALGGGGGGGGGGGYPSGGGGGTGGRHSGSSGGGGAGGSSYVHPSLSGRILVADAFDDGYVTLTWDTAGD